MIVPSVAQKPSLDAHVLARFSRQVVSGHPLLHVSWHELRPDERDDPARTRKLRIKRNTDEWWW